MSHPAVSSAPVQESPVELGPGIFDVGPPGGVKGERTLAIAGVPAEGTAVTAPMLGSGVAHGVRKRWLFPSGIYKNVQPVPSPL